MSFEAIVRAIIREEMPNILEEAFKRFQAPVEPNDTAYMDTGQAASYLDVKPDWLRKLARSGRLAVHTSGPHGKMKFLRRDLEAYMAGKRIETKAVQRIRPPEKTIKGTRMRQGLITREKWNL